MINFLGWISFSFMYTQFAMYAKPTDEQIKNTKELLGWDWIDEKAQEK